MSGGGWDIVLPAAALMINATTGGKVAYDHLVEGTVYRSRCNFIPVESSLPSFFIYAC